MHQPELQQVVLPMSACLNGTSVQRAMLIIRLLIWLIIRYLCFRAVEQVCLIKWPVSIYVPLCCSPLKDTEYKRVWRSDPHSRPVSGGNASVPCLHTTSKNHRWGEGVCAGACLKHRRPLFWWFVVIDSALAWFIFKEPAAYLRKKTRVFYPHCV